MFERLLRLVALFFLTITPLLSQTLTAQATGHPILTLPTPSGETWKVIQGYNCGTHNSWGRLSFDLVNANGRTRGAPVHAAADGTFWYWGWGSGTLIISHGHGYYTMYTHMQSHINVPRGTFIARGTQVGTVGNVGAPGVTPHLHFTFFYAEGPYAASRRPLPLNFAEGYNFPDQRKCNNHAGALVVAGQHTAQATAEPEITWGGSPERTWLSSGRIAWTITNGTSFSWQWDIEPQHDSPQTNSITGSIELSEPGKHTLFLRARNAAGTETLASREMWYDPQPPSTPYAQEPVKHVAPGKPVSLTWQPAHDGLSGVKGYQIYLGSAADGTSEWFVEEPRIEISSLGKGQLYLRVRSQDHAGNFSAWNTVQILEVH